MMCDVKTKKGLTSKRLTLFIIFFKMPRHRIELWTRGFSARFQQNQIFQQFQNIEFTIFFLGFWFCLEIFVHFWP